MGIWILESQVGLHSVNVEIVTVALRSRAHLDELFYNAENIQGVSSMTPQPPREETKQK